MGGVSNEVSERTVNCETGARERPGCTYASLTFEDLVRELLCKFGAGDEARTRNFQLGKLTLYH